MFSYLLYFRNYTFFDDAYDCVSMNNNWTNFFGKAYHYFFDDDRRP